MQQKRVVSTPASNYPPPPIRTHGRSMTIDKTSSRAPSDLRVPQPPVVATTAALKTGDSVLVPSSRSDAYPDPSNTNRRPPYIRQCVQEVANKNNNQIFDVCGQLVC